MGQRLHSRIPRKIGFLTSPDLPLFPDSRVIACACTVPWIIGSIERIIQRNVFNPSSIFTDGAVYIHANGIAGNDGMLDYAYDAPVEAFYGDRSRRIIRQPE